MNPLEEKLSIAPVERPTFEHKPSKDIMVDYARELTFLQDLLELIPTKVDYGGGNFISPALDEKQMPSRLLY